MKMYKDIPKDCWPEYTLYKSDGSPIFMYEAEGMAEGWSIGKYPTRLHARIMRKRQLMANIEDGLDVDIEIRERLIKDFDRIRERILSR